MSQPNCLLSISVAITFLLTTTSRPAKADNWADPITGFVRDAAGVVIDPLKVGKLSDQLGRSSDQFSQIASRLMDQLLQLETQTNQNVSDRIEQVRSIVANVLQAVDRNVSNIGLIVDGATRDLAIIEGKLFRDFGALILKLQCAVEVASQDQFPRMWQETLDEIKQARPTLWFGWLPVVLKVKQVNLSDPDAVFFEKERIYLSQVSQLTESDPAWIIRSKYQNLARFAVLTACHYAGLSNEAMLLSKRDEYERLSQPWFDTVQPDTTYKKGL